MIIKSVSVKVVVNDIYVSSFISAASNTARSVAIRPLRLMYDPVIKNAELKPGGTLT